MNLGGKLPRWMVLLGTLAGGAVLIWLPEWGKWSWDHGVTRGLGEAVMIAAILGFTIERWFRQDFANDIFNAALGALLPPEFRDELRWITDFKWLAVESTCRLTVEDLGDGFVRVNMVITREIQNISAHTEKFRGYIGTDDWGVTGRPAEVKQYRIQGPSGVVVDATEMERRSDHLSWTAKEISVEPGQKVKARGEITVFHRSDDQFLLALTTPTRDPEIEFLVPDTLASNVSFSHRGNLDTEPLTQKRVLKGTYLPGQFMVLRWWPKYKPVPNYA